MAALAAAIVLGIITLGVLLIITSTVLGTTNLDAFLRISQIVLDWSLPSPWDLVVAKILIALIGLVGGAPLFRWIAGIGWKCRCRLIDLFFSALLLLAFYVNLELAQFEGFMTLIEGLAVMSVFLLTIGFGWHVRVQKRAEANFEADTMDAEIETFV